LGPDLQKKSWDKLRTEFVKLKLNLGIFLSHEVRISKDVLSYFTKVILRLINSFS